MEFRSFCDNNGCRKEMRPVVDKDTLEAYCTECSSTVSNISVFMRRQLASNGQIKRTEKKKLAWTVKCQSCEKEGPPALSKENNLACSFCEKPLDHLAKPFAQMIKENLKSQKRANGE